MLLLHLYKIEFYVTSLELHANCIPKIKKIVLTFNNKIRVVQIQMEFHLSSIVIDLL